VTVKIFGEGHPKLEAGFVNLDSAEKAQELINERLK
jgi:hypothetical protein